MEILGSIILGLLIILVGAVLVAVQFACVINNVLENEEDEDDNEY